MFYVRYTYLGSLDVSLCWGVSILKRILWKEQI